jgi:hypothetical protein
VETVLNLVWLTLALTAFGHWIFKAQSNSPEQSKALRLTALVMLLVLLFPVISLTDDLQAAATMAEGERAATRITSNDTHSAMQPAQTYEPWTAVIARPTTQWLGMAVEDRSFQPTAAAGPYALGQRPPPSRAIYYSLNS